MAFERIMGERLNIGDNAVNHIVNRVPSIKASSWRQHPFLTLYRYRYLRISTFYTFEHFFGSY
jgi:hypothetical protein